MREGLKNWLPRASGVCARLVAFITVLALVGCSSSLFTGDDKKELDQVKGDGSFDSHCLGLDFSQATLDVQTTRTLVSCLNSKGTIQEYEDLVKSLSDGQLQVVLDTLNAQLITNRQRMKEMDVSFTHMDERGILNRALAKLSTVLSNTKVISAAVKLLRQGTRRDEGDPAAASATRPSGSLDPDVINSIRVLTQEMSRGDDGRYSVQTMRANTANALEMGVRATALKSYKGMVNGLRSQIPVRNPSQGLRYFIEQSLEYLRTKISDDRAYAKVLLWGIADGTLLEAFDYYYYKQCEKVTPGQCEQGGGSYLGVDAQARAMEAFMQLLTVHKKEEILGPTVELFRVMDAPIECMAGTKMIPNADMFVMNEFIKLVPLDVPQWTMRTNTMKMKLVNSMCRFPDGTTMSFNDLMLVLRELARYSDDESFGRPLVTISHFLKGLEYGDKIPMAGSARASLFPYMNRGGYPAEERYRRFLIHWLGDKNENVNAYTHLADLLGELARNDRAVVGNLLYFLNVPAPGSKDRKDVQSAVRTLMSGRTLLNGRGLYDVFSDAIFKVEASTLYDLLSGVGEYIDSPEDLANPLLLLSRDGLLVNNANPLLSVALDLGLNAHHHTLFFETLFDIAESPQFEKAMQLTAKMAGNGTLKQLLKGLIAMFRGNGEGVAPTPQDVPPVRMADPARDKWTGDRPSWNPAPAYWPVDPAGTNACYDINLNMKMGKPFPKEDGPAPWENQMGKIASCVNANRQNSELSEFLNYGVEKKIKPEKSALGFLTEIAADVIPDYNPNAREYPLNVREIYDEFSDLMLNEEDFTDMKTMHEVLPFLFKKTYCTKRERVALPDPNEQRAPNDSRYCGKWKTGYEYVCPAGSEKISVAQGLMRAMSVVSSEKKPLQNVLNVAKTAVESEKLPKTAALLYDLDTELDEMEKHSEDFPIKPDQKPPLWNYPINNPPGQGDGYNKLRKTLIKAIEKYEGRKATEAVIQEKIEAYWAEVLPAEQKRYKDKYGRTRIGYKDAEDFKASIKPLLDELSKGKRIEWLMTFFFRMDRAPYTPEWWSSWFRRLASNVHPVAYYYPGQYPGKHKPVVRLINQLEMLDLVVHNADFTLDEVGQFGFGVIPGDVNHGIKYLMLLAQAGDNPTEAVDRMDRELQLFRSMIERTGFLIKPEVKRRVHNLSQIFPILRFVDRVVPFKGSDGKVIHANDLGVLRDLFKALLGDMPARDRDEWRNKHVYHRDKNPLAVIAEMVRFGILKNVSTNMWYVNPNPQRGPVHSDDDSPVRTIIPAKISHVLQFLMDASIVHKRIDGKLKRVINSDTADVLRFLIRENCDRTSKPEWKDLPCVLPPKKDPRSFDERYVLFGQILDEFFQWIENDDYIDERRNTKAMTFIKRAGYDALGLIERLAGSTKAERTTFNHKLVRLLKPVLGSPKGAKLLGENVDLLEPMLAEFRAPHMIALLRAAEDSERQRPEATYTDGEAFADLKVLLHTMIDELLKNDSRAVLSAVDLGYLLYNDPQKRMKAAANAAKWMGDDDAYCRLKQESLDRITSKVVHWLPKKPEHNRSRSLAPRLQSHMGKHLGNGNVAEIIDFVGKESSGTSDVLYRKVKFMGEREYIDKLNDFLDLLRGGIVDVFQVPQPQANRQSRP